MIKMLVCDIDGTIFDGKNFSQNLKNCINKIRNDGIKFVIATGRTFFSANQVIAPLNVDTPIICYQGAAIYKPSGEIIFEIGIQRDLSLEILDYLKTMDIYPNIYINDKLYAEKETKYVKNYSDTQLIPYTIVKNIKENGFKTLNKILVIDDDSKKIEWITENIAMEYIPQCRLLIFVKFVLLVFQRVMPLNTLLTCTI